MIDYNYITGQL